MNREYIVLHNGEELSLEEIMTIYPSSVLFFDVDYIDFCIMVAKRRFPDMKEDFIKVYTNLLFLKSSKLKIIFFLFRLNKESKITTINLSFLDESLRFLFSEEVKILGNHKKNELLSSKLVLFGFLKFIANRVFRIFKPKLKEEIIVKSWVEISEKIFSEYVPKAQILIYPFPLKISRQLKYIYSKIRKSEKVYLMGVPYKIKYLFKALTSKNVDLFLTKFEYYGALDHASFFSKNDKVKRILTTEEYEAGSYIFGKNLLKNDIQVINRCHGLAIYSPNIFYSKFYLINQIQKDIYSLYNKNVELEVEQKKIIKHPKQKVSSIVFTDQGDLTLFNLFYESKLREQTLNKLDKISKERKVNIYIKFHPNTKQKEVSRLKKKYNSLLFVGDISNIEKEPKIFLNLFSTSYYDFQELGDFYFIKDNYFKPSFFFGNEINEIRIENFESEIYDLIK